MKTAVVTGANKGIGLKIAEKIGKTEGYQCILACRDAQKGNAAAEQLQEQNCRAKFYRLDISDPKSIADFATEANACILL